MTPVLRVALGRVGTEKGEKSRVGEPPKFFKKTLRVKIQIIFEYGVKYDVQEIYKEQNMQNIRHYNNALNEWGMETMRRFFRILSGKNFMGLWIHERFMCLARTMQKYKGIEKEINALSFIMRIRLFWRMKWFIVGVSIWMLCTFWYIMSFYMI